MQPSAAQKPEEILSPSQASTFLACSAKWRFRYGLGLPDPPSGGAVRGKAVHKLIEYAMRAKIAGAVLEPGALSDAWDVAWDQAAEGAEFQADEDIDALKASGARLAQKYICEALPAIEPAAVEAPFSGAIAGVAVRGIADIVTTDGTIIDVKTASRKPSGVAADHALQLATYAELVPGASGANPHRCASEHQGAAAGANRAHSRRSRPAADRAHLSAGSRGYLGRPVPAEPQCELVQPAILRV